MPGLGIRATTDACAGPIAVVPRIEAELGGDHDAGREVLGIAQDEDGLVRVVEPCVDLTQALVSDLPLAADDPPWLGELALEGAGEHFLGVGRSRLALGHSDGRSAGACYAPQEKLGQHRYLRWLARIGVLPCDATAPLSGPHRRHSSIG